jgi:transposase
MALCPCSPLPEAPLSSKQCANQATGATHDDDASGRVVVAKAIRRNKLLEFFASLPPCLVGLEACGSAHHWERELIKLGHDARMMPPAYVKPYIRRQKNDASDEAAICEAERVPAALLKASLAPLEEKAFGFRAAGRAIIGPRQESPCGLKKQKSGAQ